MDMNAGRGVPTRPIGLTDSPAMNSAQEASVYCVSSAMGAPERDVSVPVSSGMVSPFLDSSLGAFASAVHRDAIDCLLISPRVFGDHYRSRSTAGTLPSTVVSASSVRSKYPSSVSNPSTRPKHSPVPGSHSVMYQRQPL